MRLTFQANASVARDALCHVLVCVCVSFDIQRISSAHLLLNEIYYVKFVAFRPRPGWKAGLLPAVDGDRASQHWLRRLASRSPGSRPGAVRMPVSAAVTDFTAVPVPHEQMAAGLPERPPASGSRDAEARATRVAQVGSGSWRGPEASMLCKCKRALSRPRHKLCSYSAFPGSSASCLGRASMSHGNAPAEPRSCATDVPKIVTSLQLGVPVSV